MTLSARTSLFLSLFLAGSGMIVKPAIAQAGNLDWLAGRWCLQAEEHYVEELWLPQEDGQTMGLSRTIAGGKVVAFEFLRIESDSTGTQYFAQPGGATATAFTASKVGEGLLVVENPQHDFPQKIIYQRVGKSLTATVSGPGEEGQGQSFKIEYQACDF